MSVDFGYPNEEAIDQIGILDKFNNGEVAGHTAKHPDGWIQAVIDRVKADILSNSNSIQKVDWSDYTQEEHDAYDWYRENVVDTDHWKALVAEHEKTSSKEENVTWDKISDSDDYTDLGGEIKPPDVKTFTGGDNKDGELKVSTEAIRYFAGALEKVAYQGGGLLIDANSAFDGLDVRPGKFAKAEIMRRKIVGTGDEDPGLVGDTQGLMLKLHEVLFTLRESLLMMADSYEYTEEHNLRTGEDLKKKTEEFNNLTPNEFAEVMGDPWGKIGEIDEFGQNSTGKGGADGDEK